MRTEKYYVIPVQRVVLSVLVLATMLLVGVLVMADPFPGLPDDGRINVVTHFGGDAFYCVDRDNNPTSQYSDFGEGGFKLLDINGQQLWFVPAATAGEAAAQSLATGDWVKVADGQGTYGPVSLYTFLQEADGDVLFTYFGFDEWGKPNNMTFKFCEPVGPIPGPTDEPEHNHEPICPPLNIPRIGPSADCECLKSHGIKLPQECL